MLKSLHDCSADCSALPHHNSAVSGNYGCAFAYTVYLGIAEHAPVSNLFYSKPKA